MDTKEKTKDGVEKKNKVRMTLSCKNVKSVERVSKEIIARAKNREVKVFGPVRLPVKTLRITCRKTPNGEGSKTWDRLELRIYKRVVDLICTTDEIKDITSVKIDPGVEVELIIAKDDDATGEN